MADKKPYVMVDASSYISDILSGQNSQYSPLELLEELKKTKSLKEAVIRYADKKSANSNQPKELLRKDSESILSAFGDLKVVEEGTNFYKAVKAALKKYNQAYPEEKIGMPTIIFEGDFQNGTLMRDRKVAAYLYAKDFDIMAIDTPQVKDLKPKELESFLLHELRHKGQFFYSNPDFHKYPKYTVKAHVEAYAPDVVSQCKESGLSESEIKILLPSSKLEEKFELLNPANSLQLAKVSNITEMVRHPIDSLTGFIKSYNANNECKVGIKKIKDTQEEVLNAMRFNFLAESRQSESDADAAAKKAGLAPEMCEGLKKMHTVYKDGKEYLIRISEEDEKYLTHPTLDTRLNALGCPLPPMNNNKTIKR